MSAYRSPNVLHLWDRGVKCGAPIERSSTRTTTADKDVTCPRCLELLGRPVLKHPLDTCANCQHLRHEHDEEAEHDFAGAWTPDGVPNRGVCWSLVDPERNGACGCPGFKPQKEQAFNKSAYDAMVAAELVYIAANGWEKKPGKADSWFNEQLGRYDVTQGHAVNIQKQRDRYTIQVGASHDQGTRKRRVRKPAPERGLASQEGGGDEGVPPNQDAEAGGDARPRDGEAGGLGAGRPEGDGTDPGEGQPRT